jgi:DNA repair exonuclease SbcCD ATPase subunit
MSDETTTSEQLAEIEGQATDYTPPDGWRVVPLSEALRGGDEYHPGLDRYIRRIESGPQPEPQPEPEPQATDYTPPEGWRLLEVGEEVDIPGRDQYVRGPNRYIRPIEPQPELPADTAEELRSEVSYVQNLLGESRQRVTQLEELVASLRTINAAQEKAVVDAGKANDKHVDTIGQMQRELQQQHRELQKRALRIFDLDTINAAQEKAVVDAGKENTALRRQLAVVKEELTTAAAVSQQLQIELDAAQQVPADSPELQQLRLRLADMTLDRDQCKNAYDQIFADLVTIRETTAADTVEAIIEWLEPFRGCNSPSLALLLLEALPHIMRSLTGLADEEIE